MIIIIFKYLKFQSTLKKRERERVKRKVNIIIYTNDFFLFLKLFLFSFNCGESEREIQNETQYIKSWVCFFSPNYYYFEFNSQ